MNILWLIIRIILWLLLVLIGLIVGAILIILLAPIRYEVYFSKEEQVTYDIRVRYLGGISAKFFQDFKETKHVVRAFWKTLYKKELCLDEDSKLADKEKDATSPVQGLSLKKTEESASQRGSSVKVLSNQEKTIEKEEVMDSKIQQETEEEIREINEKVREETNEFVERSSFSTIWTFLSDKSTYKAIKEIGKCVWRIFKCIRPHQCDFELVIGEEDPADTGELIAKLTLLYPLYYQHGIIRGHYEKACVEGGFLVKGKFRLGCILWQIIRCIISPPVWKMIQLISKIRKEDRNGK